MTNIYELTHAPNTHGDSLRLTETHWDSLRLTEYPINNIHVKNLMKTFTDQIVGNLLGTRAVLENYFICCISIGIPLWQYLLHTDIMENIRQVVCRFQIVIICETLKMACLRHFHDVGMVIHHENITKSQIEDFSIVISKFTWPMYIYSMGLGM